MRACGSFCLPASTCQFKDILEIWGQPAAVQDFLTAFPDPATKVAASKQLGRYTVGWCCAHHRWCPFQQESSVRVQGPPCIDWSPAGKRLGSAGEHFPTLLASGSKADMVDTSVGILENVPTVPLQLVEQVFGPKFDVVQTWQAPWEVGFDFIARNRTRVTMYGNARSETLHAAVLSTSHAFLVVAMQDVFCALQQDQVPALH